MNFYIIDYLPFEERKKYEKLGLYCYDLRSSDDGSEIANIEKRVIVNNVGSIITNKKINFSDKDYVDFEKFISTNNEVFNLKDLLRNRRMERDTR